jgi:hypothetical protein
VKKVLSKSSNVEEKKLVNFYARTYDEHEDENVVTKLQVSSQRTFPPAPFPRKYMQCVIDDLECMVRVVHALRADGHDAGNIHVMACWDYVAAVECRERQKGVLSRMLGPFLSFLGDDSDDVYLREALRGNHVLMVRLSRYEQIQRVRDMLLLHKARIIRYIDTCTVSELSPSHEV